jgi:hypothetical protein
MKMRQTEVQALTVVRRRYNPSRGGHAPGHLTGALFEALDSANCEHRPWWEPLGLSFFDRRRTIGVLVRTLRIELDGQR